MANNMRKVLLFPAALALFACEASALIDIKLTPETPWNVGTGGVVDEVSPQYSLQNLGDPVRINIKGSHTANWRLSGSPGLNSFAMKWNSVPDKSDGNWRSILPSDSLMFGALPTGENSNVFLRYLSPRYIDSSVPAQEAKLTFIALSPYIGNWAVTQVQEVGECHPSMVLDKDGYRHISYYDSQRDSLMYSKWGGAGIFLAQAVDGSNGPGRASQIAVGTDGVPQMVYTSDAGVRYIKWSGEGSVPETLNSWGGWNMPSIALDSQSNPHITYTDGETGVTYRYKNGAGWTSIMVGPGGKNSIVQLDRSGNPHIVYNTESAVNYAKWSPDLNDWVRQTVDTIPNVQTLSFALDSKDKPHVVYSSDQNDLAYSAISDNGTWGTQRLKSSRAAEGPTLRVDANGYPGIAYSWDSQSKFMAWTGTEWLEKVVDEGDASIEPGFQFDSNGKAILVYGGNYFLKQAVWE